MNKLIIAAAGSGKTTYLVEEALKIKTEKVLITTFTESNEREIRSKFFERNGYIPDNVVIQTWFSFLLQHGVKPYQSVLIEKKINGLLLVNTKSALYVPEAATEKHYISTNMLIYSDKISKFVCKVNEITKGLIVDRISRIYPNIFIDEVQDLAGYDLDFLQLLFDTKSNLVMVGDPRQVTYHTHDEVKNKVYNDGGIERFVLEKCKNDCVEIDKSSLNTTHRNCKSICDYANSIFPEYEPCCAEGKESTGHDGVFFVKRDDMEDYLRIYKPVQLRDSVKTKVNPQYQVFNFGESKGLTFERVLIYPTTPIISWILDNSSDLKPQSCSKYYVAVTRAKYSVAIVYDFNPVTCIAGISNFSFSE